MPSQRTTRAGQGDTQLRSTVTSATATLSDAQNGPTLETPPPGRVTLGIDGPRILVRTFAADGAVQDLPFSLTVAC
jgi:hypothetical protein